MIGLLLAAALLQGGTPAPSFRSLEKGTQSFVDQAVQVAARTVAEWDKVWKQHAPGRPQPQVDFSREMVVGVFAGTRNSAGYSVDIVSAEDQQGTLVVRYRETVPARGAVTAQIVTSPYQLVAVPKHDGTVRFEKMQ
jgi:hypothetical protein